MFWPPYLPCSAVELMRFLFYVQTSWRNFTITSQDWTGILAFDHKIVPAVLGNAGFAYGWMDELGFYVPSIVFQSFRDDGRVNMKGSVQWNEEESRLQRDSNPWSEVGSVNCSATRTLPFRIWKSQIPTTGLWLLVYYSLTNDYKNLIPSILRCLREEVISILLQPRKIL